MNRFGETPGEGSYYRTERYIEINSAWYLVLRGGKQHGPFSSRSDARQALAELLDLPGQTEPRRHRDRNRYKSLENSAQMASNVHSISSSKLARLGHDRAAEPARIEFTAVAQDIHEVAPPGTSAANDHSVPAAH